VKSVGGRMGGGLRSGWFVVGGVMGVRACVGCVVVVGRGSAGGRCLGFGLGGAG